MGTAFLCPSVNPEMRVNILMPLTSVVLGDDTSCFSGTQALLLEGLAVRGVRISYELIPGHWTQRAGPFGSSKRNPPLGRQQGS